MRQSEAYLDNMHKISVLQEGVFGTVNEQVARKSQHYRQSQISN